jgi:hypothetical protein
MEQVQCSLADRKLVSPGVTAHPETIPLGSVTSEPELFLLDEPFEGVDTVGPRHMLLVGPDRRI